MSSTPLNIVTSLVLVLANVRNTNSLQVRHLLPNPEIPTECLDKQYCEHVPNYPTKYAASLIAKLQERGLINSNSRRTILNDVRYEPYHLDLCDQKTELITPKAAKDSNGVWHFILNQDDNPIQQYVAVKCKKKHTSGGVSSCSRFLFMGGANPVCIQKQTEIILVTIDRYGNNHRREFSVDCCCSCEAET